MVELAHQRHLLQVAYLDGLVGQVVKKLKAEGMWDESLVVMGADHGEGWVPGEEPRSLGRTYAPDLMWVPQLIKARGQDNGVVDDRNWEQVDLLPTIADLAGIQVPWAMEGASQTGEPIRTRTAACTATAPRGACSTAPRPRSARSPSTRRPPPPWTTSSSTGRSGPPRGGSRPWSRAS